MELLSQLQEMGIIDRSDDFSLLRDEVEQELVHLGSLKEKVLEETKKLDEVFKTILDHNTYLLSQLDTYKSYLHNVRSQAEGIKRGKDLKIKELGPYKFTHAQLEKEGVIRRSNVPENRRSNIYFMFKSPLAGTFVISLHYKGKRSSFLLQPTMMLTILSRSHSWSARIGLEARRSAGDAERQPRGS